jgi:transglutaminase-like putative cysteine protease
MKTPTFAVILTLFAASSFAPAQDLGQPTSSTPYDKYFGRIREILSELGSNQPSLELVQELVKTGRGFRYVMKNPYVPQTPAETEATRAGDCKAKSLWVAAKMDDRKVHFVVGRIKSVSGMSHAWLLWKGPAGWMVLDATMYSRPLDVARLGPSEFTPLYSYTAGGKFVHSAAGARKKAESKYGDHV